MTEDILMTLQFGCNVQLDAGQAVKLGSFIKKLQTNLDSKTEIGNQLKDSMAEMFEKNVALQAERDALLEQNKRYSEEIGNMVDKCDHYHEWADKLANEISEFFILDIGEHSSANCPWFEAWNNMPSKAGYDAEVAKQGFLDCLKHIGYTDQEWLDDAEQYAAQLRNKAGE